MSGKAPDEVRAELRGVQRQITGFGSFACRAEELEGILTYFTNVSGRINPSRLREYFGNDPLAWEAANDLIGIQRLLRSQELFTHSRSLTICLRGLVCGLRERERVLEQELAALEPPSAVSQSFWDSLRRRAHRLVWGTPS